MDRLMGMKTMTGCLGPEGIVFFDVVRNIQASTRVDLAEKPIYAGSRRPESNSQQLKSHKGVKTRSRVDLLTLDVYLK